MKKLVEPKFFCLFAFLWLVLVLVGINLLDAQVEIARQGPKPRQGLSWTVIIPGQDSGNNLYGHFLGANNIYDDTGLEGDGILIDVTTSQGGGQPETTLRLAVGNNIDEYGNCGGLWNDELGVRKIGFQDISIGDTPGEDFWYAYPCVEYPCFFPTNFPYDCENPCIGWGEKPSCLEDFLNGLHPYEGGQGCLHPECCYYIVEIKMEFDRLILDVVEEEVLTGIVWIRLVNTFDLQSGCEYPHNVEGYHFVEVPGDSFKIRKKAGFDNTWVVAVDGAFTFAESYKAMSSGKKTGGKGTWEYKIPYWALIPLTFEMEWTRVVE